MESDDLLVTLGLSSYETDLRTIGKEISNQCREWDYLNKNWTGSAYLIPNSEFRINSKYHASRRGEV